MTRRVMATMLLTGLFTLTTGLFAQRRTDGKSSGVYNVSLIQVIANPNEFNGQRIRVVGYLGRNGLDKSVGIFVSEVDGRNFVLSNSIDVHVEESTIRELPGKYVVLSGTYHSPIRRSGNNGYVDHVLDLKPWNTGDATK